MTYEIQPNVNKLCLPKCSLQNFNFPAEDIRAHIVWNFTSKFFVKPLTIYIEAMKMMKIREEL